MEWAYTCLHCHGGGNTVIMALSDDRVPETRRRTALGRFLRDARGGTAMEYAMIGALIFAVAAGTIRLYGSKMNDVYARIGNAAAQVQ